MTMIRTSAPTVIPVSIDAARTALRVDGTELDTQIDIWVKGITADMEHETGQCVMEQTWEVRLPGFPSTACWQLGTPVPGTVGMPIELPHPVMSVTSVTYIGSDGSDRVLTEDAYRLNKARYTSTLTPARGASWPATAQDEAAVKIVVQAGYGADPTATPEEIQLYILARLIEQFDPVTRTERDSVRSNFTSGLLDRCRIYR